MRRTLWLVGLLSMATWAGFAVHEGWAYPEAARATKAACVTCHTNVAGGAGLTDAGKAFGADKTVPAATEAAGADYVGSNKCRMCHLKQHKAWAATPHAAAMSVLEKVDAKVAGEVAAKLKVEIKGHAAKTDDCVKCHVTGFQLAGGYPAADSTKNANLAMVGCESCHGPGSAHIAEKDAEKRKALISKTVSAKMCTACHTPEMSPSFNFDEYVKKGVHAAVAAAPAEKKE